MAAHSQPLNKEELDKSRYSEPRYGVPDCNSLAFELLDESGETLQSSCFLWMGTMQEQGPSRDSVDRCHERQVDVASERRSLGRPWCTGGETRFSGVISEEWSLLGHDAVDVSRTRIVRRESK